MTPVLAANLLNPNFGLVIWITIVFSILLLLLSRFAWKPITTALKERESRIDSSLKQAERLQEETRKLQADNEKARRDAEQEARRMLAEARETAEKLRTDEIERTKADIALLKTQAQDEIERQKQGALDSLRAEVATIAVQAAERILKAELDEKRHAALVNDFVSKLASKN